MRHRAVLVMTVVAAGVVSACSDDGDGGMQSGGAGGTGGAAGMGGAAGTAGMAGASGSSGAASPPPVPPTPALAPGSPTVACPTTINGSLDAADRTQTGRHSRIAPVAACGMSKAFPGNAADPSNPHLYDVYRFANPGAAPACFTFALNYGAAAVASADAGSDAGGADASAGTEQDAGLDAGVDAGLAAPAGGAGPARYLTAYSTFYPTDLANSYLGDVGDTLNSPQTFGITVPAGGTIDVVVYAIDVAPAGVGSYTLSCSAQ